MLYIGSFVYTKLSILLYLHSKTFVLRTKKYLLWFTEDI